MADSTSDNSETLGLNTSQAYRSLDELIKQAKTLRDQLRSVKGIGDEKFDAKVKASSNAIKEMKTLIDASASAASNLGQKSNIAMQSMQRSIERTGTALGVQANQLKRAAELVKQALTVGATSGGASFAAGFKKSTDAAAAYEGQLKRVQRALVDVDRNRAYSGNNAGRTALVAQLEKEVSLAAALKERIDALAASEREEANVAKQASKAAAERISLELDGDRRIIAMNAERFALELEGMARVNAMNDEVIAQQVSGYKRVAAEAKESARQQAAAARQAAGSSAGAAPQSLASRFAFQATRLVNYAALGAAFAGGAEIISQVVKLDEALHNLQGITQTSDAGMGILRDRILEVSAASKFMASDVADAATILGQAGLSATQIGDALKAVVVFAQGAGTTLPESVNLITAAMGAFNLRASESMAIANTFTAALNNSKLTVQQLSTGFQYSATAAAQLGMSYTELVTTMQLMADAGIKSGSMIGTGIRQILNQLSSPNQRLQQILQGLGVTLGDIDVRSHGLAQVMETLKSKGFDAGDAFAAFGTRGASAFIALSSQVDNFYDKMNANIGTNAAIKAADTQMQSLANTARNTGAEMAAAASKGFQPLLRVTTQLISVVGEFFKLLTYLGPVIEVAATALGVFGTIKAAQYIASITNMTKLTTLFAASEEAVAVGAGEMAAAVAVGSGALEVAAAIFSPMTIAVAALTVAIVAFNTLVGGMAEAQSKAAAATEAARGKFEESKTTYESTNAAIETLISRQKDLKDGSKPLASATADLGQRFKDLGLDVNKLSANYDGLLARMREIRGLALKQQGAALTDLANQNRDKTRLDEAALASVRAGVYTPGSAQGLLSQYPGISSVVSRFGAGGINPSTTQDLSAINSALATARGIDQSGLSSGQSGALKILISSLDRLSNATETAVKDYGRGGAIDQNRGSLALQGSAGYKTFQSRVEQVHSDYVGGLPNFTGLNAASDEQALASYQAQSVASFKSLLAEAKKYAATNAEHAAAAKPVIEQINAYLGEIIVTDKRLGAAAKKQVDKHNELNAQLQGTSLETSTQALGEARTVGDANAAYAKVKAAQKDVTKAAIIKEGTTLGLRPGIDFTVDDNGNVSYLKQNVSEYTKDSLSLVSATEAQKVKQQQQSYDAKIGALNRAGARTGNAIARGDIQNDIAVLQAELSSYIKDQAAQLKTFDKNSPSTDVQEAYAAIIHDINLEVARQIDIARAKFDKLKHTDHPMTPEEEAAIEKAIRDAGDDKRAGALSQRDETLLQPRSTASSFADAWANIQKFSEDARKTISTDVNEFATTFQDVMEAAITSVKSSLATFWTSIIEGTDTVGGALKKFAKSILESVANSLTQNLAQKATNWLTSLLPGGADSGAAGLTVAGTTLTTAGTSLISAAAALTAAAGAQGASGIGSTVGSATSGGGGFFDFISDFFDSLNGGGVVRRAAGGLIPGAIKTRDSVYQPLNVGDFVMRSTAVRNIGLPALHAINSLAAGGRATMGHLTPGEFAINGASARMFGYKNLSRANFDGDLRHLATGGTAGMPVGDVLGSNSGNRMDAASMHARDPFADRLKPANQKQAHTTTNVWVVKPDERPPTTKQDIVVAISEDILSNGATKKLIKSIQAGG